MTTIFRFAIQTTENRRSEVLSFFCNRNDDCLYVGIQYAQECRLCQSVLLDRETASKLLGP